MTARKKAVMSVGTAIALTLAIILACAYIYQPLKYRYLI